MDEKLAENDLLAKGSWVENPGLRAMSDLFIQYLFARGQETSRLLDFINAVLDDSGLPCVTSVDVCSPFNIQLFLGDTPTILDVKVQDETGRWYDIEVQTPFHRAFRERIT